MLIQTEKRTAMSNHPFQAFIDLISVDQDIRNLHHKITQLQQKTDQYLAEKQEVVDRLNQFKQHVHELRKMVDAQELEMKELDQKEKEQKERLETISNVKEHQALKKEIERFKREQHEAEAQLMGIWNKLEIAQKELTEQQTSYETKLEELHKQIHEQQEQINILQQQLETKKSERPAKEAGIPQDWLDKYTHMRMQVDNPVVPVERGGCSACFYTIPDQELLRLNRRALVQCKGCFRLLYAPEAMQAEQAEDESKK